MYIGILIKIIGTTAVIMASLTFAKETNCQMKERIDQLIGLYGIFNKLESELKYLNRTLPECFSDYAEDAEYPFKSWFLNMADKMNVEPDNDFSFIWSNGIEYLIDNSALTHSDIDILSGLKDKLGSYDVDVAIKSIDYALLQLEERRQELLTKAGERQKVTVSMCLFIGLMTVILLI